MLKQKVIDVFSDYLPGGCFKIIDMHADYWIIATFKIIRGNKSFTVFLGRARVYANKLYLSIFIGKDESFLKIFDAYDRFVKVHPDLAGHCAFTRE